MLVHMFDKQGLLNTRLVKWGRPGGGEFYSGSIIRTAKAFVWGGGDISGGFVLAPSTQILCAYDHDQGTDGQANGGCPIDHEWSGDDLLAVLEAGAPQTAYWINEIIVGGAAWERSLPGGVEAFFTSGGRGADQLRAGHRAFLEEHGLCASQACRGLGGKRGAEICEPDDERHSTLARRRCLCCATWVQVPRMPSSTSRRPHRPARAAGLGCCQRAPRAVPRCVGTMTARL